MSAHLSVAVVTDVSSHTGASTIYTAPASNVYAPTVCLAGETVFIGWYDSTGNTLHDQAVLVGPGDQVTFGPMASGDIIVAGAHGAVATVVIGEIY